MFFPSSGNTQLVSKQVVNVINTNWRWLAASMEELGESMGIKAVFQPMCSETSLGGETKPCRSSSGLLSEAAAPLPEQAAVFLPRQSHKEGESRKHSRSRSLGYAVKGHAQEADSPQQLVTFLSPGSF